MLYYTQLPRDYFMSQEIRIWESEPIRNKWNVTAKGAVVRMACMKHINGGSQVILLMV